MLECNEGLAEKNTKKRENKESGESITPIRYNVIHMYIFTNVLFTGSFPHNNSIISLGPHVQARYTV